MKGQTVFILGKSGLGCHVAFVENPYTLTSDFAFADEIEQKFSAWYRAGKLKSGSDWLHFWWDGWKASGSAYDFDAWCRMITGEAI